MLTETTASYGHHLHHPSHHHHHHHHLTSTHFPHYDQMTGASSDSCMSNVPSYQSTGGGASCPQPPASSSSYGKEIEQLESLAIALCSQEIVEACQALDISQDPVHWSSADVASWISWQVHHKNWPPVALHNFTMNGMELSLLTEDDFVQRAPLCGSSLFAQLDLWKLANLTLASDRVDLVDLLLWSPNTCNSANSSTCNSLSNDAGAICTSSHGPTCSPVHSAAAETHSAVTDGGVSGVQMATLYQQAAQQPPQGQPGQQAPAQQVIANCHSNNVKLPLEVECMSPPSCTLSPYGSPDSLPSSPHTSASSTSCDSPISSDVDTCSPLSPLSTSSSSIPGTTARTANHIHLWQFLKELLSQPQLYGSSIRWLDRNSGVFKIEDSVKVARLWGKRKNRPAMNYDKLSRSIRQYYKKGIMRKTERSQRLVYQFCHPYSH